MAAYVGNNGLVAEIALRPQHKLAGQSFRHLDRAIWWAKYLAKKQPAWAYVVVNDMKCVVWDSIEQKTLTSYTVYPNSGINMIASLFFWRRSFANVIAKFSKRYK